MNTTSPLAVVTGASSGIGFELAKCCLSAGYAVLIAADEPAIFAAQEELSSLGGSVEAVQADLSTTRGVAELYAAIGGRPVAALLANAGRGLGHAFLDQNFDEVRRVIDTNVTGTLELVHKVGRDMRQRGQGRILITGSIAGFMPGTYQAVYNGTKALIDSFSIALRAELDNSGVTVTCLMPGPTETSFFARSGQLDTAYAVEKKQSADEVAREGFEAMQRGDADAVTGLTNKLRVALSHVIPDETLAEMHRKKAEPGSAYKS